MKNVGNIYISIFAGGMILLSGLLASGCKNRPKMVLNEKKMIELIADLKLAEAYASIQINGQNPVERREELSKSVLAAHNVTQEQFDSTLVWYGRNLDEYAEIYEKVDKRLLEKRKKLLKDGDETFVENEGDNLWSFQLNGVLTTLGTSDGWIFSIPEPGLQKGDRLEWRMHINSASTPMVGVLGVDYEDGTSEAVTTYFTNRPMIDLSFQTDTSKIVNRVYGTMRVKKQENMPLFADSISLRRLPFDSLEFNKFRSQKRYGYPIRVTKEDRERKAITDSIRKDSLRNSNLKLSENIKDTTKITSEETHINNNSKKELKSVSSLPIKTGSAKSIEKQDDKNIRVRK